MIKVLRYTFFSFVLFGLTSCDLDLAQGDIVRSDVSGTFYIALPELGTDGVFQEENSSPIDGIEGSVLITIGNTVHVVYPSVLTYDSNEHHLIVPVATEAQFEGAAVVTCVSRLTYTPPQNTPSDENPDNEDTLFYDSLEEEVPSVLIPYAGYLITTLKKDIINLLNDKDNDGFISDLEKNTTPLSPATRLYEDILITEPVIPETEPTVNFSNIDSFTDKLVTKISGNVFSLDWGLVYVRINNNYQWIETAEDTTTSGGVYFPKDSDTHVIAPLKPGINEIQLFAVNSKGLTVSPIKEIKCTAQKNEEKENLLVTLTWDSFADLDLHTWYYSGTPLEAVWHNYYFQANVPLSDEVTNLDADRKKGLGPEHFSLFGAEDGYYIIAVNAYSFDYTVPHVVNAYVTIETNNKRHSLGPFKISDSNNEEYPVNGNKSWARIADIEVKDGEATLLVPNLFFDPPPLPTSLNSSIVNVNAQKVQMKTY